MFSFRKSLKTFVKGQLWFLLMLLILLSNVTYWQDPYLAWTLIVLFIQPVIFLLAFVDGFRKKRQLRLNRKKEGMCLLLEGFSKVYGFSFLSCYFLRSSLGMQILMEDFLFPQEF